MKRWVYEFGFTDAVNKEGASGFVQQYVGEIDDAPKYSPTRLIGDFSQPGIHGWELVTLIPVPHTLEDGRIIFSSTAPSNTYFYAMKKRITKKDMKKLKKEAKKFVKKVKAEEKLKRKIEAEDPGWKIKE